MASTPTPATRLRNAPAASRTWSVLAYVRAVPRSRRPASGGSTGAQAASMSAPEPYGFMSAASGSKRPWLSMSPSANAIAW